MGRKLSRTDDVWVDWLQDEPLPAQPRSAVGSQQQLVQPTSRPTQPPHDRQDRLRYAGMQPPVQPVQPTQQQARTGAGLSIQIEMPSFTLRKPPWLAAIGWQQVKACAAIGAACMVMAIGTRAALTLLPHRTGSDVKGVSTSDPGGAQTPGYSPVVPSDKSDLATPADGRASYDSQRQMYTYNDTLSNATIVVSQQPLPQEFKSDSERLGTIAASVGAKEAFDTAFGTAYMSTADGAGDQRIVLSFKDMLIFIKSDKRFDSDAWKLYIESLR